MSITGPDILRSIEEALRDIRREEDESTRRLARSVELATKLRAQEADLFRQNDSLSAAAQAALEAAAAAAERVLDSHDAALEALDATIQSLDAEIAAASPERAQLQAEAGVHDSELGRLAATSRPGLNKNPAYVAALTRAQRAQSIAVQSAEKALEAETDRGLNGAPYRRDSLFMYLWEKAYGTKAYRANVLVAWLDGWVASVIGYADARVLFSAANDIPSRLRDYANRRRETADAVGRAVAEFEQAATDAAGGGPARAAMQQALDAMHAVDARIVALQDQRDDAIKTQRQLAQGGDASFAAATAALNSELRRPELAALLGAARSAGNSVFVQQVVDARQRGTENDLEAHEEQTRLKRLATRRRELEDIQFELKAQGFDAPSSRFGRDEVGSDVLNDLLRGEISAGQYWQIVRDSQRFEPQGLGVAPATGTAFSRPRGKARAA